MTDGRQLPPTGHNKPKTPPPPTDGSERAASTTICKRMSHEYELYFFGGYGCEKTPPTPNDQFLLGQVEYEELLTQDHEDLIVVEDIISKTHVIITGPGKEEPAVTKGSVHFMGLPVRKIPHKTLLAISAESADDWETITTSYTWFKKSNEKSRKEKAKKE